MGIEICRGRVPYPETHIGYGVPSYIGYIVPSYTHRLPNSIKRVIRTCLRHTFGLQTVQPVLHVET